MTPPLPPRLGLRSQDLFFLNSGAALPADTVPFTRPSVGAILDQLEPLKRDLDSQGLQELLSLSRENDAELFFEALYHFGVRLEQRGHGEMAGMVYSTIVGAGSTRPSWQGNRGTILPQTVAEGRLTLPLQQRAQERLDALRGEGSVGLRLEVLGRTFARQAMAPAPLIGMGVAGLAFRGMNLFAATRLANLSAGLWTRGPGLRILSGLAGFAAEVPAFTFGTKFASSLFGEEQDYSARVIRTELASGALVLGSLKLFGAAFGRVGAGLALPEARLGGLGTHQAAPLQILLQQAGMLTGIMAGHGLEVAFGLRERQAPSLFLAESLVTLAQFNVAGRLSHSVFGERYARLQQSLAMQAERIANPRSSARGPHPQPLSLRERVAAVGGRVRAHVSERARQFIEQMRDRPRELQEALAGGYGDHALGGDVQAPSGPAEARELQHFMTRSEDAEASLPPVEVSPETPPNSTIPPGMDTQINWQRHRSLLLGFLNPARDREKSTELSRLYYALERSDVYFRTLKATRPSQVPQEIFLERVIEELRRPEEERTEGDKGKKYQKYQTAFSVLQAIREARKALHEFFRKRGVITLPAPVTDPFSDALSHYPLLRQGGYLAGVKVAEGTPRRNFNLALRQVRDLMKESGQIGQLVEEMRTRKVTTSADGRVEIIYKDGRRSMQNSDGTFQMVLPDGRELIRDSEGRLFVKDSPEDALRQATWSEYFKLRPVSERLYEARKILRKNKIRLVTVLGAGRHGTALMDIVRNSMSEEEKIDDQYIIPVMLEHSLDSLYELNVYGTNRSKLPGITINSQDRLALKAFHPRLNNVMLALADTVFVTLPSNKVGEVFTSDFVHIFGPNTTLVVAIKSVIGKEHSTSGLGGDSIPEWFFNRLAEEGRYDLMYQMVLQAGLGFPSEMMGYNEPTAAFNLSLNSINLNAATRVARLLIGDEGIKTEGDGVTIYCAPQRRIEVGQEMFIAAYWGFIKNILAPGVGYDFASELVKRRQGAPVQELHGLLSQRVAKAREVAESTYMKYELPTLKTRIEKIIERLDYPAVEQGGVGGKFKDKIRQWLQDQSQRTGEEHHRILRRHFTGIEDLLGCTGIQDVEAYQRVVWDLLENSQGLVFKRRLDEYQKRVKNLSRSSNFTVGLIRPVLTYLIEEGKIVEVEVPEWGDFKKDRPEEGLKALPHIKTRWGDPPPPFIEETLKWLDAENPPFKPLYHDSGIRLHVKNVVTDYLRKIVDETNRLETVDSTQFTRENLSELIRIGRKALAYMEDGVKRHSPSKKPDKWMNNILRLQVNLIDFDERIKEFPRELNQTIVEQQVRPFLKLVREIAFGMERSFAYSPDESSELGVKFKEILNNFEEAKKFLSKPPDENHKENTGGP